MSAPKKLNILLVAGGTGGHIWPAISFGTWLQKTYPDVGVLYMSGMRAIEMEIYRAANIEPISIAVEGSPIGAPWGKKIRRWRELARGFSQTSHFLNDERPDVCVLFGGYVSLSALLLCRLRGIPVLVHEQNASAGRVSRLAARMGVKIVTGWPTCHSLDNDRFEHIGIPVRRMELLDKNEAWEKLSLPGDVPSGKIILVLSGTLGSESLSNAINKIAEREELAGYIFLTLNADKGRKHSQNVISVERTWNMALLYSLADVIVTRGGASTLFEIYSMNRPALVVPWRNATGDHQMHNACAFIEVGNGTIWSDKNRNFSDLTEKIKKLAAISQNDRMHDTENMYNVAERICARLWSAVLSEIEGRDLN